jgi:transposase
MRCALRFEPPQRRRGFSFRRWYLLPDQGGEIHGSKAKTYTPKFKFQLVLEVLYGECSESEIGPIYGAHHATISNWKRRFLENGAEVFGGNEEVDRYREDRLKLERMIGQNEVELALLRNDLGGS